MKEIIRALIEANGENEKLEEMFVECGRTEQFKSESKELIAAKPDWMESSGMLLQHCMPPERVHPVIAAFQIMPESIARHIRERMVIAHKITMRQIDDILKERFEKPDDRDSSSQNSDKI